MTVTDEQLEEIVKRAAERLQLHDWAFTISRPEMISIDGREGYDGACETESAYYQARVQIQCHLSEDQIKQAVIHELLHVVLDDMDLWAVMTVNMLRKEFRSPTYAQYKTLQEQLITRLTRILTPIVDLDEQTTESSTGEHTDA